MEILGLIVAAGVIWIVWKNLIHPTHNQIKHI